MPSVRKHSHPVPREKRHVRGWQARGAVRLDRVTDTLYRDGQRCPKKTETRLNCVATTWVRCGVSGSSYARVI